MNILTFDIEEWFLTGNNKKNPPGNWHIFESRVEKNTGKILELLNSKNVKATFFILGWVAEKHPSLIRKIAEDGHEVGYHTYYHQQLADFTPDTFVEDLKRGVGLIESITSRKVKVFRAPCFSFTGREHWLYTKLIELGFSASSSIKSGVYLQDRIVNAHPIKIKTKSGGIFEFPLSNIGSNPIKKLYPGSGYLRVMPLSIIRRLVENHDYLMFYFHPRDVDERIPFSTQLSLLRNFKNRVGAKTGLKKLSFLLDALEFLSIEQSVGKLLQSPDLFTVHEWADTN